MEEKARYRVIIRDEETEKSKSLGLYRTDLTMGDIYDLIIDKLKMEGISL